MLVEKKFLMIFLISFVILSGPNITGFGLFSTFIALARNIVSLYLLLSLVMELRSFPRISPVTVFFIFYVFLYNILTLNNGDTLMLSNNGIAYIKSIIMVIWLDVQIQKEKKIIIDPILWALVLWCCLDCLVTFAYPMGAPFLNNGYIFGWKNNKLFFLGTANLLWGYRIVCHKKNNITDNSYMLWLVFSMCCVINAILIQSSTTMTVILIIVFYILFENILSRTLLANINFVLLFHLVIFIVLIFVREIFQDSIDQLMQLLFQKDATFTGRIYIWKHALALIAASPIWGYGAYKTQWVPLPSGGVYGWTMPHNQILALLMEGGFVMLFGWIIMLLDIRKKFIKQNNYCAKYATVAMFAILFFFHTEAAVDLMSIFYFLCIYYIAGDDPYQEEQRLAY